MKHKRITEAFDFNSQNIDNENGISQDVATQLFADTFTQKYLPLWDITNKGNQYALDLSGKYNKIELEVVEPYKIHMIATYLRGNKRDVLGEITLNGNKVRIKFTRIFNFFCNTDANEVTNGTYNLEYILQIAIAMYDDGDYILDEVVFSATDITFHRNQHAEWTKSIKAQDIEKFPKLISNTWPGTMTLYIGRCVFYDEDAVDSFTKYCGKIVSKQPNCVFHVKKCSMTGEPVNRAYNDQTTNRLIRKYITKNVPNRYRNSRKNNKEVISPEEQAWRAQTDYYY